MIRTSQPMLSTSDLIELPSYLIDKFTSYNNLRAAVSTYALQQFYTVDYNPHNAHTIILTLYINLATLAAVLSPRGAASAHFEK